MRPFTRATLYGPYGRAALGSLLLHKFSRGRRPLRRRRVRGCLGDRVGRDAQGISISRQPASRNHGGLDPLHARNRGAVLRSGLANGDTGRELFGRPWGSGHDCFLYFDNGRLVMIQMTRCRTSDWAFNIFLTVDRENEADVADRAGRVDVGNEFYCALHTCATGRLCRCAVDRNLTGRCRMRILIKRQFHGNRTSLVFAGGPLSVSLPARRLRLRA